MPKQLNRDQTTCWGLHDPTLITGDIVGDDAQDYDTQFSQNELEVAAALGSLRSVGWGGPPRP